MTKEDLACKLDGAVYPFEPPMHLAKITFESGLVIVYGASDDLMEFRGAIEEEISAFGGTIALLTTAGLFDMNACDDQCCYFQQALAHAQNCGRTIEACFDSEGYSWTYMTAIPHATFDIFENGEKYCRGIVFNLADVNRT